jgi:glutamate transport system permease protein
MTTVLFDAPGPRGRRRVLLGSAIALAVLAVIVVLAALRLNEQGQFESEKWAPIFDPGHERFESLWTFLLGGLWFTLQAAFWAMLLSLIIGTLFAVTRISAARWYRWLVVSLIEVLRGLPVVVAIFFANKVLPQFGVSLPFMWYLVIGLTAYNSVVIGEIIRAGVQALPKGQTEAAYAIGLTRANTLRYILLPQAFRIMLPALISQLVVVLKDTSLGAFIGYLELLRRGSVAVQTLRNPMQMFLLVGAIFILINYALSKLAVYVERRLSRGRKAIGAEAEEEVAAAEQQSTASLGG